MTSNFKEEKLKHLEQNIRMCTKCDLHRYKTNYVIGHYGNLDAKIAFVHTAPSVDADLSGNALAGINGAIFKSNLQNLIGLKPEDYHYLTCVKCIPKIFKDKRPIEPNKKALFWCAEYLYEQLDTLDVEIIVPLGYVALFVVLKRQGPKFDGYNTNNSILDYVGKWYEATSLLDSTKKYKVFPMANFSKQIIKDQTEQFIELKKGLDDLDSSEEPGPAMRLLGAKHDTVHKSIGGSRPVYSNRTIKMKRNIES